MNCKSRPSNLLKRRGAGHVVVLRGCEETNRYNVVPERMTSMHVIVKQMDLCASGRSLTSIRCRTKKAHIRDARVK
jgi:hypothetical protein